MNYFLKRIHSFACAIDGVLYLFATQAHAWLHLFGSLVVIALGIYLKVDANDWIALIFAMCIVWVCEAFNTAIELTVDLFSPMYHPLAGKAKDVAAGAVLLASFFALIVGLIVFSSKYF